MLPLEFEAEAQSIAARNLTPNVAAVGASFDSNVGHLHVVYYLYGPPTDDDEEWRELTVGELIAAFPDIRTASSGFGACDAMGAKAERLVFTRT